MADGAIALAPISGPTRTLLVAAGFRTAHDVFAMPPSGLAKELRVDVARAADILAEVASCCPREREQHPDERPKRARMAGDQAASRLDPRLQVSALSLLEVSKKQPCIVTFCRGIDTLLGGGMPTGEVTEVVGVPGVGKTQLCTQLAVDASLPKAFGGVDGQTLYIDTEGSFTPDRGDASSADAGQRSRQLAAQAQALHSLAATRGIAVVVVNHVTTKLGGRGDAWGSGNGGGIGAGAASEAAEAAGLLGDGSAAASAAAAAAMAGSGDSLGAGSQLAPALGDSWAHACTNRLFLYWFGKVRVARLAKSPSRPLGAAAFAVTSEGVRRPPAEGSA
ncbi:hypothetical protein FNF28_00702 [Cafeteria roenbergensis]|uniref:DNA repair protein RAD51 homolog 3 n=1 Tax=Cafeteria roenbergensis TaxID=33653 RepID=A0A5A8E5Z3_CAFRO|nr:hypothetical protein FNF28_00702 [Cafeteria roenbergensis]